jgi:hypothetical protein
MKVLQEQLTTLATK